MFHIMRHFKITNFDFLSVFFLIFADALRKSSEVKQFCFYLCVVPVSVLLFLLFSTT